MSHAGFLRDLTPEGAEWVVALVQVLHRAGLEGAERSQEQGLGHVLDALGELDLVDRDRALVGFVAALTLRPRGMTRDDLGTLVAAGFSERLAHDVVHVVACFSYMNRLADGLGVTASAEREAWGRRLYGDQAWADHVRWGTATSP